VAQNQDGGGSVANTGTIIPACSYSRPAVADAILAILFGLTAKAALDQLFGSVTTLHGVQAIWDRIRVDPIWHLCLLGQAVIFFVTSFRFYLGAMRYHQLRAQPSQLRLLLFDILGTFILFIGFYLCALSIKSYLNFYLFMGILHFVDFLWFSGALAIAKSSAGPETHMGRFVLLDGVTMALFIIVAGAFFIYGWSFGAPYIFQGICFAVLLGMAVWDFLWNRKFYLGIATP